MYGYDHFALAVVTPPALEPVTVEQVRANSRLDGDAEDDLVALWITAAREYVESHTRRSLITQTRRLALDGWPCSRRLLLPRGPVQSVSSITYDSPTADAQTFDAENYRLDADSAPPRIVLSSSADWPCTVDEPACIRIEYVAGYGDDADSVPAALRSAILLLVGDLYEHREAGLEQTITPNAAVDRLLGPYLLREIA